MFTFELKIAVLNLKLVYVVWNWRKTCDEFAVFTVWRSSPSGVRHDMMTDRFFQGWAMTTTTKSGWDMTTTTKIQGGTWQIIFVLLWLVQQTFFVQTPPPPPISNGASLSKQGMQGWKNCKISQEYGRKFCQKCELVCLQISVFLGKKKTELSI